MERDVTIPDCGHVLSPDIVHHDCEHGLNVYASSGIPAFVAFDEDETRSRTVADFVDYIAAQQRALDVMIKVNTATASARHPSLCSANRAAVTVHHPVRHRFDLTDDELAAAATAALPCPEGFYWRRCQISEYSRRVKDGLPAMVLNYSGDDDSHIVFMITERQGGRS